MLNVVSPAGTRDPRPRPEPSSRRRVFTAYVRELTDRGEEEPGEDLFDQVWNRLAGALAAELRRRGLWDQPPRFLGVAGGESWDPLALEELVAEAYAYNFVDRLRSLRAQLEVKPNVDGLVIRNLRQMLTLRLRGHDPVGYRVFQLLRGALREEVEAGELHVVSGDPRLRNDTVLAFDPAAEDGSGPDRPGAGRSGEREEAFSRLARRWSDELLPELITARGPARRTVTDRIRERIPALARQGLSPFRFRSLIDPLKRDVRARWAAFQTQEQGETAVEVEPGAEAGEGSLTRLVRLYRPRPEIEERQAFRQLARCVREQLEDHGREGGRREARTRGYLQALWAFLERHAVSDDEETPSRRRIARELGIPRDRLPGLFRGLGEIVETCQEELAGRQAERPPEPGSGERSEP